MGTYGKWKKAIVLPLSIAAIWGSSLQGTPVLAEGNELPVVEDYLPSGGGVNEFTEPIVKEVGKGNLGASTLQYLNVNGINILKAKDYTVSCGAGTAVFNPETEVLRLENAEISKNTFADGPGIVGDYVPEYTETLHIELVGNNTIKGVKSGISINGILEVGGSGNLTVFAEESGYGISAFAGCRINNTRLTLLTSGDAEGRAGINVGKNALLCSGSTITISGYDTGINVSSNEMDIQSCFVEISAIRDGILGGAPVQSKDLLIDRSTLSIHAKDGCSINGSNITLDSCSGMLESSSGNGIYSGSSLTIENSDFPKITGSVPALFSEGGITVTGSNLDCSSSRDIGIFSRGLLSISSSTVHAKGGIHAGSGKKYAAVAAPYIRKGESEPPVRIILDSGYEEVYGGRIAASEWGKTVWNGSAYVEGNWTSFIPANAAGGLLPDRSNALNEITIRPKQVSPVYTVTFNTQGGSAINAMAVVRGGIIYRPDDPVKDGFLFTGWYKDPQLTQAWEFERDTVIGNLTLYAGWEPQAYTVTFDSRGGSQTEPAGNVTAGSLLHKPADPQRKFYIFTGWYQDEESSQLWDFSADKVTKSMVLYAGWKPYTPETPVITKVTSGTSAVRITWKKCPGVTGYVVYGYTGDAYTRGLKNYDTRMIVRRASSITCLEQNLKPGTQRTYLVRAYKHLEGKNYYGSPSKPWHTATKPRAAVIKSITPMKGAAYVVLKEKVEGAAGYTYCTSADGEKYRIVAKGSKEPYKMKGLSKGVNYIKLRTYTSDILGRTVYGNWSKIYIVKVL